MHKEDPLPHSLEKKEKTFFLGKEGVVRISHRPKSAFLVRSHLIVLFFYVRSKFLFLFSFFAAVCEPDQEPVFQPGGPPVPVRVQAPGRPVPVRDLRQELRPRPDREAPGHLQEDIQEEEKGPKVAAVDEYYTPDQV